MHQGCITKANARSRSVASAVGQAIESLEARQLLTIVQDDAGWSVINQDSGGNKIYVSDSDGSDSFDGTSPAHITGTSHGPFKTLSKGRGAMGDGKDDWLLLKRGDTWNNQTLGPWNKNGPS